MDVFCGKQIEGVTLRFGFSIMGIESINKRKRVSRKDAKTQFFTFGERGLINNY